jgi:hypothetical protein
MDGEFGRGGSFTVRLDYDDTKKYHVNAIKRDEKVAFRAKDAFTISGANLIGRAVARAKHLTTRINDTNNSEGPQNDIAKWFMAGMP